jgi:hypothetical protein
VGFDPGWDLSLEFGYHDPYLRLDGVPQAVPVQSHVKNVTHSGLQVRLLHGYSTPSKARGKGNIRPS